MLQGNGVEVVCVVIIILAQHSTAQHALEHEFVYNIGLSLPNGCKVDQGITSHQTSLVIIVNIICRRNQECRRDVKRCSGVTSQRGLPREPVHIHVQVHG